MADEIKLISETELSKVESNLLNSQQLNLLLSPTPEHHIYKRPAKGGGEWCYVTGTYVKKVLNLMFGWDWDFEIMDDKISLEFKQVIVKGRLTCRTGGGQIIKTQYGRQDIKFKVQYQKDEKGGFVLDARKYKIKDEAAMAANPQPLDIGNDLKGATTDALKKCASELGIASDVYAPNEFKAVQVLPERDFDELKKLIDNVEDLEMLQMLCESFTVAEMKLAADLVEVTQNEFNNG